MAEVRSVHDVEANVQESFKNVKYDIQTINSWIFELYRNHSIFPQKFDEASRRIVISLETELNKLKDLFQDFAEISSQQMRRVENLENVYNDVSIKLRNSEHLLERVEESLGNIDMSKLNRLVLIESKMETILDRLEKPAPKEKKKTMFYSSGNKGSKFHTRDCLAYRRIKKPKSYDTVTEARKANLRVCRLCMPAEK